MNKKMSILFVVTQGSPWGGAQRYVFDLATALCTTHTVHVALGESRDTHNLVRALKHNARIKVHELPHLKRNLSLTNDIRAWFELKKLFNKVVPDIIHLNSSKAGILGVFAGRLFQNNKIPILYTAHGWVFMENIGIVKKIIYKQIEAISAKLRSHTIVLSEEDRLIAKEVLHIPNNKVTVIPNGILPFSLLPKEQSQKELFSKNIPKEITFWFGSISNLYQTKNIPQLIDAFQQAFASNKKVGLVIVGDGPERNTIEQIVQKYNLHDRVHLVGFKKNASQYLLAFDTFVLASYKEGFPYALLESTYAGVPTITTQTGGTTNIIQHKKTGLIVQPNSSSSLIEALTFAYENKAYMQGIAKQGQKNTKQYFALSHMIEKTQALYNTI